LLFVTFFIFMSVWVPWIATYAFLTFIFAYVYLSGLDNITHRPSHPVLTFILTTHPIEGQVHHSHFHSTVQGERDREPRRQVWPHLAAGFPVFAPQPSRSHFNPLNTSYMTPSPHAFQHFFLSFTFSLHFIYLFFTYFVLFPRVNFTDLGPLPLVSATVH